LLEDAIQDTLNAMDNPATLLQHDTREAEALRQQALRQQALRQQALRQQALGLTQN